FFFFLRATTCHHQFHIVLLMAAHTSRRVAGQVRAKGKGVFAHQFPPFIRISMFIRPVFSLVSTICTLVFFGGAAQLPYPVVDCRIGGLIVREPKRMKLALAVVRKRSIPFAPQMAVTTKAIGLESRICATLSPAFSFGNIGCNSV